MRLLAPALLLIAAAAGAQMPFGPQPAPPLKFLPLDEVKKQIAAARGLQGAAVPDPEERRKVVAEVNGEKITLDQVLDEVMNRFGESLVPGLLNQAVMRMEAIKRGTTMTGDEFAEGVQLYLAQKKTADTRKTLREVLAASKLSWKSFARMVSDQVKIAKVVRADMNMPKRREPLNPFLVQIWAGQKLRGLYTMEMNREKLPPGVLGAVSALRPVSGLLADVAAGAFTVSIEGDPDKPELTVVPAGGGWPHYRVPNVPIDAMKADGTVVKAAAAAAFQALADAKTPAREKRVEPYLRVRAGAGPPLEVPPVQVVKQADAKSPRTSAPLAELLGLVGKKGFGWQRDGTIREKEGSWPAYRLPAVWLMGTRPPALADVVKSLQGKEVTVAARVRVNRRFDLPDAPITMFSDIDREYVLAFSYGKLQAIHYREALKSLARYRATKQAFAARHIRVDEKAVKALIDAEEKKFSHPLFNRKLILQAKGKTVFDENRRLWVGNGVDQIIGTQVDDRTLRKYYQDNILHFGMAEVEAAHILVAARNPKTGKVDYERARRRIDQIAGELFSRPRPALAFAELARRYSEDKMTASKGGDLGPFTLRGQMAKAFAEAAFALRPGEISAPVKTVHGYHLILCKKYTPPNLEKYPFEDPEVRARVKAEYQQERRDRWLEAEVYARMKLKRLSPVFGEKP